MIFDVHYSISPTLPADNLRVVLDWGDEPQDLDAHFVKRGGYHVSYHDSHDVAGRGQARSRREIRPRTRDDHDQASRPRGVLRLLRARLHRSRRQGHMEGRPIESPRRGLRRGRPAADVRGRARPGQSLDRVLFPRRRADPGFPRPRARGARRSPRRPRLSARGERSPRHFAPGAQVLHSVFSPSCGAADIATPSEYSIAAVSPIFASSKPATPGATFSLIGRWFAPVSVNSRLLRSRSRQSFPKNALRRNRHLAGLAPFRNERHRLDRLRRRRPPGLAMESASAST